MAAAVVVTPIAACQQIAGIEQRTLAEEGEHSSQCQEYCKTVLEACPTDYTGMPTCLGVCDLLDPGDPVEPASTPNSVACRLNAAKQALNVGGEDKDDFCQAAGPGGNGSCGDNCESYCSLVEQACGEFDAKVPNCPKKCQAFGDSGRFDVAPGADHEGDTVQCRLVHVSSATVDPEGHCTHADFHPSLWCDDEEPTCERYCRVVSVACTGDNAVYETDEQCMAACKELDPGDVRDDTGDTVGCRTWHAVSALYDPDTHCPHSGPTGDGHCGHDVPADEDKGVEAEFSACRPYCRLLATACEKQFSDNWDSEDACVAECDKSDEDFGAAADQLYTVASMESGDTLGCRTLHAVRAFEDDSNCDAAFGAEPCN